MKAATDEHGIARLHISTRAAGALVVQPARTGWAPRVLEHVEPPDGDTLRVTVTVGHGHRITGSALDWDGRTPFVGRIVAVPVGAPPGLATFRRDAVLDDRGNFVLTALFAGRFRLDVHPSARAYGVVRKPAPVVPSGARDVAIVLGPRVRLTILMTDADTGNPILTERSVRSDKRLLGSRTGFGSIVAHVEPGAELAVSAEAPGYATGETQQIRLGARELGRTLQFALEPEPDLDAPGTLILRMRLASGGPVGTVKIMHSSAGSARWTGQYSATDTNGVVELTLPAGKHKIRVGKADVSDAKSGHMIPNLVLTELFSVTIAPDGTTRRDIVLRSGGYLRVTNPQQAPFELHLEQDGKRSPIEFRLIGNTLWIARAAPGTYELVASRDGLERLRRTVTIREAATTLVDLIRSSGKRAK